MHTHSHLPSVALSGSTCGGIEWWSSTTRRMEFAPFLEEAVEVGRDRNGRCSFIGSSIGDLGLSRRAVRRAPSFDCGMPSSRSWLQSRPETAPGSYVPGVERDGHVTRFSWRPS